MNLTTSQSSTRAYECLTERLSTALFRTRIAMVSGNREIAIRAGARFLTRFCHSLESAFGLDAGELNFDRSTEVVGKMLTFNGNSNDIAHGIEVGDHDTPPRRCPGYGYALDILEFLVDRYAPHDHNDPGSYITPERFEQIKRKGNGFLKFVLKMGKKTYAANNRYFPSASEVQHPLDTKGKALNPVEIAIGGIRTMPEYGKSRWQGRLGYQAHARS